MATQATYVYCNLFEDQTSITIPGNITGILEIHAIGAGQTGQMGQSAKGGWGGSWSVLRDVSLSTLIPGNSYDIQIGDPNPAFGGAGGSTWLKNGNGTIILRAKGGGSGDSNIGDESNLGGEPLTPTSGDWPGGITTIEDAEALQPWGRPPTFGWSTSALVNFAETNLSGGGGGGAGGPNGPGGNSGDLRPFYFPRKAPLNDIDDFAGIGVCSAAGGSGDGGQPGGGTYTLANGLLHYDNFPVIPGEGGDDLFGYMGGKNHEITQTYQNSGTNSSGGGLAALWINANGSDGGFNYTTWIDSEGGRARNDFNGFGGPGGGAGGLTAAAQSELYPTGPFFQEGSHPGYGGDFGGGGGGGGSDGMDGDNVTTPGFGGAGCLVLIVEFDGVPPFAVNKASVRWI